MSALPPKADIVRRGDNVRFVPKADIRRLIIQRLDRTEKGIRFPASALLNVDGLRLVRRLPRHMFRTKALCIPVPTTASTTTRHPATLRAKRTRSKFHSKIVTER
jgi:hypothetical protein